MKSKIIVPRDMQAAIAPVFRHWTGHGSHHGELEEILEPALRWLAENPIVPTEKQWRDMPPQDTVAGHIAEWQRRMFLAPTPNPLVFKIEKDLVGATFTQEEANELIKYISQLVPPDYS
jgi:hypothetical protein